MHVHCLYDGFEIFPYMYMQYKDYSRYQVSEDKK